MANGRGGQFLEFIGDDGVRNIVRVSAIQWLSDTDECRDETFITVANRTVTIRAPLDHVREALAFEDAIVSVGLPGS